MRRLDDVQTDMLEKNHKLIYFFMNDKGLSHDEFYSCVADCLVEAIYHYNPEKSKLSTFFFLIAGREVGKKMRKTKKLEKHETTSKNGEGGYAERVAYVDMGAKFRMEEIEIIDALNEEELLIYNLLKSGYSRQEVSSALGVSMTATRKRIMKLKDKIKELMQ